MRKKRPHGGDAIDSCRHAGAGRNASNTTKGKILLLSPRQCDHGSCSHVLTANYTYTLNINYAFATTATGAALPNVQAEKGNPAKYCIYEQRHFVLTCIFYCVFLSTAALASSSACACFSATDLALSRSSTARRSGLLASSSDLLLHVEERYKRAR